MATLQVRDLPDDLYVKLRKKADQAHRSLAQQAIVTLATGLQTDPNPKARRQSGIDRLPTQHKEFAKYGTLDSVRYLREDRER